jgi:hypothetical protein
VIALSVIYPILFSVIFGYYNGWQWTDEQDGVYDAKSAKKRWKAASLILRGISILYPVLVYFFGLNVYYFLLGVAISLPVFDITINLTRGVSFFYLGTTSKTDRWRFRIKWKGKVLFTINKWIGYAVIIAAAIAVNII